MKLKFKLATLTSLLCANALAAPIYQPPGSNLTYGSSSNNQSIMSSIANPAAAAAVLGREDSQYRFGIITFGAGYELGNISDLYNQIDATKATMTTAQTIPPATIAAGAVAVATYVNSNLITPVNNLTAAFQKDGNASVFFAGHIPFTPFVVSGKGLGGSIVVDANANAIANMSFISDPLAQITAVDGQNIINGGGTYTLAANDSTLLVKAAVVGELSAGYSRPVLEREAGNLTAGVRAKFYQVKLASNPERLTATTGGAQSTLKASQTYASSSGVGLDVGTLWTSKHYRAGAWVNNLNKPSFKYNANNLAGYTSAGVITQLSAAETYTMKPQLQLEGAIYSESQNWVINAGLDANAVQDPVGRDFQWATLSASYATDSWLIPGARIGMRSNRVGSKLSYITGGVTLFKALSLDLAYSTNSVADNTGKSAPRSIMFNLGIQMTF